VLFQRIIPRRRATRNLGGVDRNFRTGKQEGTDYFLFADNMPRASYSASRNHVAGQRGHSTDYRHLNTELFFFIQ
jgi:hypothetical protein